MTVLEERVETERKSVQHSAFRAEGREVLRQESRPESYTPSSGECELIVERRDITFQDVAGDKVRIRVTVHNRNAQDSRPTTLRIEAAPFGAFVPWKPLTVLPVRALQPGESLELATEAARPRPTPLGGFDRVPPKKLLTALDSPDQRSSQDDGLAAAVVEWLLNRQRSASRNVPSREQAPLPPDLMELLGRPNPHWAGNVNVHIGSCEVERHMAQALRIYPGRTNLADFLVGGSERPDAYAFKLVGPDWEAKLYDHTTNQSLLVAPTDTPIGERCWVEAKRTLMIVLAIYPPAWCQESNLQVHVTRRSSGKTAIVEFNLDPAAKGAGCYTV